MKRVSTSTLLPLAVGLLGLIAALAQGVRTRWDNEGKEQLRFEELTQRAVIRLRERLEQYEHGVRGTRGAVLVGGGEAFSAAGFRAYAASRDVDREFPGALGFGVVRRVPEEAEAAFVGARQAEGWQARRIEQFSFHPGERFVITYVDPEERNRAAIGLDLASEPRRREAALAAARSGRATLTGPIQLVQASGPAKPGVLLFLPIYRSGAQPATPEDRLGATLGWAFSPLSIEQILQSFDYFGGEFALTLSDRSEASGAERFYASPGADEPAGGRLGREIPLQIFGRSWLVNVRALPLFRQHLNLPPPAGAALGIALIGLLLAGLLYVYLRDVARTLVAAVEHSRLAAIVQGSSDGIIGSTVRGVVTSWNAAAERLLGYSAADAVGKPLRDFLPPEGRGEEDQGPRSSIGRGEPVAPVVTRCRHRDGRLIDVSVTLSPIKGPDGRVIGASSVVRDIRAEQEAEARLRELNATLERQVEERTRALEERNRALEIAHRDLENMMDGVPYATFVVDDRGVIEMVNAGAAVMFARPAPGLVGHAAVELVPERLRPALTGDPAAIFAALRAIAADPQVLLFGMRPDGTEFPMEVALSAITLARGQRTLAAVFDISERRRQESLIEGYAALQTAIFAHAGFAILALDETGRVTQVNPAAERLSGFSAAELIRAERPALLDGIHERAALLSRKHGRAVSLTETLLHEGLSTAEIEWNLRRNGGQLVPVAVKVTVLKDSAREIIGFVLVAVDLTERKRVEDALRKAVDEADAANRAKSDFLANMSHEIRTPMNAILGFAYLLEKADLPGPARDTVRKIHAAGRSLLTILNDILDFSKIEAGRVELEHVPFRVADTLANLATMLSASTGYKPVEVLVGPAPMDADHVYGDPLRLSQILTNLGSNALKFTERGEVVVSVELLRSRTSEVLVRFSVRDTGVGIRPEQRDEIFSPFGQADTSITRRFGGTGLGLAIAMRLVALMGGRLTLESEPGKGSTFSFDLLMQRATPGRISRPLTSPLRVLIADDHPTARGVLAETAASVGWLAETVASGEEAVALALASARAGTPFDLLLLDGQMPGLDGLSAAARVKEALGAAAMPMIVMTTAAERAQLLDPLRRSQVDELLMKPVTGSMLLEALGEMKQRRGDRAGEADPATPAEARLTGMRVLVVDDREINREVATRILEEEGAEVATADDGQAALEMLGAAPGRFDVVLMDVQMPVMDGYETTRQIRQNPALRGLPVVALTAGAFRNQHDAALAAGMDGFIAKGFDVGELVAMLRRVQEPRRGGATPGELAVAPSAAPVIRTSERPASLRPEALPLIDIAEGLSRLRKESSYKKVLDLFSRTHQDDERALVTLLQDGAVAEARSLVHKLRGSAASLSLSRVALLAGGIEASLQSGEDLGGRVAELDAALAATRRAILAYVGPPAVVEPAAPRPSLGAEVAARCLVVVERLITALDRGDPAAAESRLGELGRDLPASDLDPIQQRLDEFDFARAGRVARDLLDRLRTGEHA